MSAAASGPPADASRTSDGGSVARPGVVRDFAGGVADLGRGFRLWGATPRLMLLGLVPAAIVGAVWVTVLLLFLANLDGIAAFTTASVDAWAEPWRDLLRIVVALILLVAVLLFAGLTFTAVVLAVGDPFYERISRAVELRLGHAPPERHEPWPRSLLRAVREGALLILVSAVVGLVSLLLGLIPVAGPALAIVFGATVGGWFLVVELTGVPFAARGLDLRARRRLLRGRRARAIGFGAATWLLFLVPLGAILVMPAAVSGATILARAVLEPAGD